jgi:hypothetical protein
MGRRSITAKRRRSRPTAVASPSLRPTPRGKARSIRSRDSLTARPLPDTDGASLPFWSPDGSKLAFFAQGQLKTIAVAGGSPHAIARAPLPRGGSWSRDDVILFTAEPNTPPRRVPAAGGEATPVPFAQALVGFYAFPTFLPDSRHYLFMAVSGLNVDAAGFPIRLGSLDSPDSTEVTRSRANPLVASGQLLFRRDATLVAQPFDLATLRLSGSPVPIVEATSFNPITNQGLFSVSNDGCSPISAWRRLADDLVRSSRAPSWRRGAPAIPTRSA